jgi:hypothetical protein
MPRLCVYQGITGEWMIANRLPDGCPDWETTLTGRYASHEEAQSAADALDRATDDELDFRVAGDATAMFNQVTTETVGTARYQVWPVREVSPYIHREAAAEIAEAWANHYPIEAFPDPEDARTLPHDVQIHVMQAAAWAMRHAARMIAAQLRDPASDDGEEDDE